MIPLTLAEVAAATGGTLHDADPGTPVTAPAFSDSRAVRPGGLFVAVAGERVDGHDFGSAVVEAGAAAVLAARPLGVPSVVVDDPVTALGLLARSVHDRLVAGGLVSIGLTGSSGKTSTKDLLAQVLETAGPTVAPRGSLNTEVGVPVTVLEADEKTRHLVVEMGARGPGHIAYLCEIAPPRIGVVLNVGAAHAEKFGGPESTAEAKRELVEAVPAGGVAVLNADDELVMSMEPHSEGRVVTFGRAASADVRAEELRLDPLGRPSFRLVVPEGNADVQLRLHGAHHVSNALAVAAVARELGMPVTDVAAALSAATPRSRWRMEVTERADGVTVVNDAYNANPESVRAALEAVAAMSRGRRTWAVLGEMLELGAASTAEHERVGRLARRSGVDRLVVVGDGARSVHDGALAEGAVDGEESVVVADVPGALEVLLPALRPDDVVLVKASRGVGLERVADALLGDGPGGRP
ncbi:MAG TPA: UDP-N-acetylmuramoyl-tripeptide--D-alanyl-D-alanine ligase [Actinomycetes bacterium]|nr:UDP-N-acetylmuramoyl-tripeptide--D-alanyl-D-alanine ligase [Actinomycetes bacterium]